MDGVFEFYTCKTTPTLNTKHFYCTILEICYNKSPICVPPDSTMGWGVTPGWVTITRTPRRSSVLWWASPGENCQCRILHRSIGSLEADRV